VATTAASILAQLQVTPPRSILVNSPIVTINDAAGNQTLPHGDEDLAAYTDEAVGVDGEFFARLGTNP
jgi:hypothetical protein